MKKRPSKTQIKRALLDSVFDPRSPGPSLGIIIEENTRYFEIRAIECIREAREILFQEGLTPEKKKEYYQDRLTKALSLIALAKVIQ